MNSSQFCKIHGDRYKHHIKKWYDAGYLKPETWDEETHQYNIPDDFPVPHIADSRIKDPKKLIIDILQGAAHARSIYPSMYKHINKYVFDNIIKGLIEKRQIEKRVSHSGYEFYVITDDGVDVLERYTSDKRITNSDVISIISSIITLASAAAPVVAPIINTVANG